MASPTSRLEAFPPELSATIQSRLTNLDVKNLRLVSSKCSDAFRLHFKRIFLSANSRNIQVLRAIADHPSYRFDVQELVWDDARLIRKPRNQGTWPLEDDGGGPADDKWTERNCPYWFQAACERSIEQLRHSVGHDGALPQHTRKRDRLQAAWDLGKCWEYYEKLLTDEDEVIESGGDIEALRYALERFPSLQTITVTPATHGILFLPAYNTPMIRSFPDGFLYPIPRTWPAFEDHGEAPTVMIWNDDGDAADVEIRDAYYDSGRQYRNLWRGYSAVLQSLVDHENTITELIVDAHGFDTGVNCYAVCEDCPEQKNFARLCAKDGFRRLDLALFVNGTEHSAFAPLRSGKLRSALSTANDMQHFHFSTNLEMDMSGEMAQLESFDEEMDEHFVSLGSLFPVDTWSHLQVFCLTKFLVLNSDLVALLGKLPQSVRSVELNMLLFLQHGTYQELLEQMDQQLDWRSRPRGLQPNVSISVPPNWNHATATQAVTLGDSVVKFLYQDGMNPFSSRSEAGANYAQYGQGAIEWDWFDPEHRRPYEDDQTQADRGYYGYMDWDDRG